MNIAHKILEHDPFLLIEQMKFIDKHYVKSGQFALTLPRKEVQHSEIIVHYLKNSERLVIFLQRKFEFAVQLKKYALFFVCIDPHHPVLPSHLHVIIRFHAPFRTFAPAPTEAFGEQGAASVRSWMAPKPPCGGRGRRASIVATIGPSWRYRPAGDTANTGLAAAGSGRRTHGRWRARSGARRRRCRSLPRSSRRPTGSRADPETRSGRPALLCRQRADVERVVKSGRHAPCLASCDLP